MNPAFECFSDTPVSELLAYVRNCKAPVVLTDTDFIIVEKSPRAYITFPTPCGISMEDTLKEGQGENIRRLRVGQIMRLYSDINGTDIITVSRFSRHYCFYIYDMVNAIKGRAMEINSYVADATSTVMNFCDSLNTEIAEEAEVLRQITSRHFLRQMNASKMLGLAAGFDSDTRCYFEPSMLLESTVFYGQEELERNDTVLFNDIAPSYDFVHGSKEDYVSAISAMLAASAELSADGRIKVSAADMDMKYIIEMSFKSGLSEEGQSSFLNGEVPFGVVLDGGLRSERLLYIQCLAASNGWYFKFAKERDGTVALILVMPVYPIAELSIESPTLTDRFRTVVLTQLKALDIKRKNGKKGRRK